MNPIVISTIIASASFILTIFFAIYLNQPHMDKLMEQIDRRITENTARLEARINENSARVEAKVDVVRAEVAALQKQVDRIDQQVSAIFKPILPPRS